MKLRGDLTSTPGPGQYTPGMKNKRKDPNWRFGSQIRGHETISTKDNPGPGNYEIKSTLGTGKRYGMGIRLKKERMNTNPGPADYRPKIETYSTKKGQPKIGFGTSKRVPLRGKKDVPGPGSYKARPMSGKTAPRYGFGKANRADKLNKENPGPGNYEIKNMFDVNLQKRKGKTMASRHSIDQKRWVPGPGTYEQDLSKIRPKTANYK